MPDPALRLRRQAHRLNVLAGAGLAGCATVADPKAPQDPVGADIDVAAACGENGAAGLAGDVVTGAASLPFRSLVRRLSGAHKRDRNVAAVILGGMVRRGFLKGQRAALGCPVDGA